MTLFYQYNNVFNRVMSVEDQKIQNLILQNHFNNDTIFTDYI